MHSCMQARAAGVKGVEHFLLFIMLIRLSGLLRLFLWLSSLQLCCCITFYSPEEGEPLSAHLKHNRLLSARSYFSKYRFLLYMREQAGGKAHTYTYVYGRGYKHTREHACARISISSRRITCRIWACLIAGLSKVRRRLLRLCFFLPP
jgi:hypothetical protein